MTKANYNRRRFMKLSAATLAAVPLMGFENSLYGTLTTPSQDIEVYLFSKHLQFLGFKDMSEAAAEMGFNGLDLTVRPKGHVLPDRVTDDLPKAVDAMKKFGLAPKLMTTNVVDSTNPEQLQILETASKLEFTHYRTGWLKYPEDKNIAASQAIFNQQFRNLAIVNKELGLIGGYQNHAGKHVGAPIWDLPPILDNENNKFMGCQYDIRHAVAEGGGSWELGLQLVAPLIRSIVIKDFKWGKVDGKWKPINVPLGEGMVDFTSYFSLLKKYKIKVPVSLHLEYDLGGAEHGASTITMDKKEVFNQMKKDLSFLRAKWANA